MGDARFQRKCLGKMSDIAEREGRTVLFVSHNMGAIQRLCDRSLLIGGRPARRRRPDRGRIVAVPARRRGHRQRPHELDRCVGRSPGAAPARRGSWRSATPPTTSRRVPAVPGRATRVRVRASRPIERRVPCRASGSSSPTATGRSLVNADILTTGWICARAGAGENLVRLTIDGSTSTRGSTTSRCGPATWSASVTTSSSRHSRSEVVVRGRGGLRGDPGRRVRPRDLPSQNGTSGVPTDHGRRGLRDLARAIAPRWLIRRLRPALHAASAGSTSAICAGPARSTATSAGTWAARRPRLHRARSSGEQAATSAGACSRSATRPTPGGSAGTG